MRIVITPFCLALLGPHLEYVFSFSSTKQRFMNYSKSSIGASRFGRWLDCMSCKEKLQELGLSSLKKGMPRRNLIVFKPLRITSMMETQKCTVKNQVNHQNLQQGKFD